MSIYQSIARFGPALVSKQTLFKAGFNLSPMYRRSTGRIISVSSDLHEVKIILPISYRNRNYVGSIFGGSLFSAVDPIPMVQLINILGNDYVVWDKSASIQFKAPAKEDVYAEFQYTKEELSDIKGRVARDREIEVCKVTLLKDKSGSRTFCAVEKTLYVADKVFYKEKLRARKAAQG
jgi:acyl-coenzyme A thioesterase PaaI-like protein